MSKIYAYAKIDLLKRIRVNQMSEYQVIARKFRPQSFKKVVGQDAIVTTLKNAIKFKRLAQAYLFCGSRGTGKTTLARIFAKALNCQQPSDEGEPCEECASCREITHGSSLDVIEIDGASNRGIDDIRQINETVGYAATSGGYKIYIIDEVHMLTKEAFNALLKTLEEPPPKVKFFFATTEPHKVLPTILSRCQRFNLSRIPLTQIVQKLAWIATELKIEVEEAALERLAQRAEGGLRDAESLFDQVIAFSEGHLSVQDVDAILGLMPKETFFEIDRAVKEGQLHQAFEITHRIFNEGKDLSHFIEGLIEHYRTILLIKLSGQNSSFLSLNTSEKEKYLASASIYSQDQCLELINYLVEAQQQLRLTSFGKIGLEAILLHVLHCRYRLSVGQLVARLHQLEKLFEQPIEEINKHEPLAAAPELLSNATPVVAPSIVETVPEIKVKEPEIVVSPRIEPVPLPIEKKPIVAAMAEKIEKKVDPAISEDPTPSAADFGKPTPAKKPVAKVNTPIQPIVAAPEPPKVVKKQVVVPHNDEEKPAHIYDTLMQFAAVELEGKLQRHF